MLKYAALLFNTIALLIYQFFFADTITITQKMPSSVKAESEFTVEIVINKGSTGGFAKLQEDLPEGFTAVQDENNGSSFTFSGQSVKFIWMSLPTDQEFKIKYKVKVAAGVSGDKIIAGKFSYITDNVKQSVDITPFTINVSGGGTVASTPPAASTSETAATPPVNTADGGLTSQLIDKSTPSTPEASSVTCTRTAPANASGDFTVELLINKGNIVGFAKLVESLPAGLIATAGEVQGASFSFSEGKAKFVWVSMPAAPEFKISYKVSIAAGTNGNQNIDGVFSYIENDETKKYTIPVSAITIGGGSQPVVKSTEAPSTTTEATPTTIVEKTTGTPPQTTPTTTASTPVKETPVATEAPTKSLAATSIPAAQGNVNYKVQIAALHNAVEANQLAARYSINQKIDMEMADGFTKYIVGGHSEYKSARDAREEIRSKGVNDAFVTAYNSGKRITVQEALMITSQKWYR